MHRFVLPYENTAQGAETNGFLSNTAVQRASNNHQLVLRGTFLSINITQLPRWWHTTCPQGRYLKQGPRVERLSRLIHPSLGGEVEVVARQWDRHTDREKEGKWSYFVRVRFTHSLFPPWDTADSLTSNRIALVLCHSIKECPRDPTCRTGARLPEGNWGEFVKGRF